MGGPCCSRQVINILLPCHASMSDHAAMNEGEIDVVAGPSLYSGRAMHHHPTVCLEDLIRVLSEVPATCDVIPGPGGVSACTMVC